MKAFEVSFGNSRLWGAGTYMEVDLTILADDLTDAMMKASDAVEAVKEGLQQAGCMRVTNDIRVLKVEERDPVLNPKGELDADTVKDIVMSMKEDLTME